HSAVAGQVPLDGDYWKSAGQRNVDTADMKVILTGHKDIDRVLKALPKELQHTVQQQAHVDAAKPLIEKEKLLAPEGPTGNLVDSIGAVKIPLRRANFIGEVH